ASCACVISSRPAKHLAGSLPHRENGGRDEMTQAQLAQGNYPLLAVRDVSVVFGGIIALNGVSFDMKQGHILGLSGPHAPGHRTGSPKSASAVLFRTSRCFPICRCSTTSASAPMRAPPATSSATR